MNKLLVPILITMFAISSGCIQKDKMTDNAYKDPHKWAVGSCQFNPPAEKTIIIRIDDIQGWWNQSVISIINATLDRDIPVTLAIMPYYWTHRHARGISDGIENDTIIKNYLISKIKDSRIEIAQHGTFHTLNEYKSLNELDTYNLAQLGLEKIVRALNLSTYPVTFIPPYNEYNENTTKVLSKLGFKIISAKQGEYGSDGNMIHIGFTVQAAYGEKVDLAHIDKVLSSCNRSLEEKNVCVVMIHPQDYAKKNSRELDMGRYKEFIILLDALKTLNVKFSTFKDLLSCNDTKSIN